MAEEPNTIVAEDVEGGVRSHAEYYIVNRINEAVNYAFDAQQSLADLMKDMGTAAKDVATIDGVDPPSIDIREYFESESGGGTPDDPPDAPTHDDLTPDVTFEPDRLDFYSLPEFGGLSPLPDRPDNSDAPSPEIQFYEEGYVSTLLEDLKQTLSSSFGGGTGLDAEVEQALYDRDRARREIEADEAIDSAMSFFAGRNFNLPAGVMASAVQKAVNEKNRTLSDQSNDVMVKAADMEQQNRTAILQYSSQLEGLLLDIHDKKQSRALEAEKTSVQAAIDSWRLTWERFNVLAEAVKIEADVKRVEIDAASSYNQSVASVNSSYIDAEKSKIDAEISRINAATTAYRSRVDAFGAEIQRHVTKEEGKIKSQDSVNKAELARADAAIKASQANLEAIIAIRSILLESHKSGTNVSAQVIASALQSVNAGVTYGYSGGYSSSHRYDETKGEAHGVRVSYDENHSFKHAENETSESSLIDDGGNLKYDEDNNNP